MKSSELIRFSLQMSAGLTELLVSDLKAAPMTQPRAGSKVGGGNHAIWTLGHLCYIEGTVPHVLFGEGNPVEDWKPLFDMGSEPGMDASVYPSFDELLGKYKELRGGTMKILDRLGDGDLDAKPKIVPPGFEKEMQTIGQALQVIALHNMTHCGQISDARRAAGIPRLF